MDEDSSADAIWAALKAARAALLAAGAKAKRVKALDALVALVAEVAAARGRLLHKWRAWGWLLLAVQLAVQRDAQELLALPDVLPDPEAAAAAVGQKRKRAKSATARLAPPRLELWSALLLQLEALHAAGTLPSLHLDGNGRSLLERLFSYSAAVISRVRSSDAEFERMAAPLDAFAWRSVAFVAQFRVYCAVIPHDALQTVLEFALSALDDGDRDRFDRTGVDTRNAHALRANFVRLAVKNYPFDLQDGLPVLVECLTGWFHLVRPENVANTVWNMGSMASGETVHRVATVVLDALASLCKRYHSCIGPLLLTAPNLLDVLHFIQRTWRTYKVDTHGPQLQFIAQFIQLYRYNAGDGLAVHGVERMDVCRELNGLARALLDTKELVDLATARKTPGRGTPFSSKAPGSTALDVHMHTEDMTMLHLVCSADVIHLHDQIASAIVSDRADSVDAPGMSTASQALRVRLLWERIVDNACQAVRISSSEIISGAPTFFPIASDGRDYGSATGKLPELSGENVVRVGATWMLVLLALLSRHGDFYVSTRIADIMTLLTEFGESLVTKEIRQTQYYVLLTLIQLADLHAKNRKACSDLLDELWVSVWHTLLRADLPYSRVTGDTQLWRESAGDAVLTLLNFMVASPLVSDSVIVSSSQALWCLPAFQKGVGNASIIGRKHPASTSAPRSMMATILLTTMLNCVQLPDQPNSPLLSSQHIPSSTELSVYSADDTKTKQRSDIPTRSELLKTVFEDLRAFVIRETPTERSTSIEYISREEHVPVAVATLFGAFLCLDELRTLPSVRVFFPTMLRRLEAPIRVDLGNTPDAELSGFGIPFGLSEEGLNFLMSDDGVTSRINPNYFSTLTTKAQALLPCNTKPMTTAKVVTHASSFERLSIPPSLLNVLSPQEKDTSLEPWIASPRVITTSISDASKSQLHAEIANEFSVILNELSSQISHAKAYPHQVVSHLINLQQIGLILALLFMNSSTTRDTTSNFSSSQIVLLMKTVLEIFTAAFSPGAITRARLSLKTAPLLVQVFVKFYSFILTLQSPDELALCNHPSSVPRNFRILPELRPAIRQVVAVVEESLALATEDVPTSSSEGDRRGRHPAGLSAVRSSVSTGGNRVDAMDVESNAADKSELYLSDPIQMTINLWCFRVVLLLKKEAGLEVIKRHAGNLQLSPDFVLALSVITTGIPAADSVDMVARLVHHSITEAAGESKRMQWHHSFSGSFFITQVLYALALAAEAHEIRKAQHPEDLPVSLLECAQKYLDMSASHPLRLFVPQLRAAEVRCLEVFFRLNPDAFPDFENAPLDGILDASFVVRVQSARALQTLLYMFPDGQASICGEIANRLNGNSPEETRVKPRATNKTIDMCCTDALCWFICAGVFEDVIPNALDFYVRMASDSRRAMGSSTLKSWISAIAYAYDYSSSVGLVSDHFGFLWWSFLSRQFAALNRAATKGKSEPLSISQVVDKFPFGALNDEDQANRRTNRGRLDHFVEKMDVIFPLTVLASSIEGSSSLKETEAFSLVHELAKLVAEAQDVSDEIERTSAVNTQLPLDLVAFSLIFKASGLKDLQVLADQQLKNAMPERISTTAYGQIIGKLTQFVVMGLTDPRWLPWGQHHEDEGESDSVFLEGGALWVEAIACMKNIFEGFNWQLRDLSALFGRLYLLLLQSSHFTPCAERAVDCFQHFARSVLPFLDKNAVLQRLVLVICFQAIKQLTRRPRKRVARSLTFLVRELCETFMKTTDTFGRYLSLVVEEIGDILMVCGCSRDQTGLKKHLYLDEDDQGHLEWVVFAICNDMASLGKFAQDVHAVPKGVSTCLDKLGSILDASRSTLAEDEGAPMKHHDAEVFASAPPSSIQASEYLRKFIEWESNSEARFYRSRRAFGLTSRVEGLSPAPARAASGLHQRLSSEVVRLSKVSSSIHTLRQSSRPQDHAELVRLVGKLAHVLLYRSWRDADHSASEHPRDSVLISIADALGDVGALDSYEFDLSPGADMRELSRLFQYRFQRGALCETSPNFLTSMHEQLVAWLSSLLFEQRQARAKVISEALIALRRIQGTNEGLWAHSQSKDKDLKQFLSEFYAETTADWSASIGISTEKPMLSVTRTTLSDLWRQSTSMDFQAWICAISATLAEETPDLILQACRSLMKMRADLAVFAFPYLIWTIFDTELDSNESPDVANAANRLRQVRADVNDGVRWIVKEAGRDYLAENGVAALDGASAPRAEVVQTVLHTINFLRETEKVKFISTVRAPTKSKGKATTGSQTAQQKPSYGCILDVDLLDIARAAVSVKMPFSAMQYVEMWIEHTYGEVLPLSHPVFDNEASSAEFRQVLVEAYRHDSNIDGVYGVSDGRTFGSQLVTYIQEGDYSRTLPLFDVMLQFSGGSNIRAQEGMLLSLQKLGYNHLLEGYMASVGQAVSSGNNSRLSTSSLDYKYERAWKNMQWNAVITDIESGSESLHASDLHQSVYSHQKMLFESLKAIVHRDFKTLPNITSEAKMQILQALQLSLSGLETTQESYRALGYLQSIREIEEVAVAMEGNQRRVFDAPRTGFGSSSATPVSLDMSTFLESWQQRHTQIRKDFDTIDNLLAVEEVLIKTADPSPESASALSKLYLSLAARGRKAKRVAIAYSALLRLEQLKDRNLLNVFEVLQWKMQRAKLLWGQQEGRSAIWTAKQVSIEVDSYLQQPLTAADQTDLMLLQINVLTVTGKWIAAQRSESSQVIIDEYFKRATNLVEAMDVASIADRISQAAKAHLALAEYMGEMHQQVNARIKSREWLAGKKVAEARAKELAACKAMRQELQDANRMHILGLEREVEYDKAERASVEQSVDLFLIGALGHYGKGLGMSSRGELATVFKVVSLWFANYSNATVDATMKDVIETVPSYKFVPLSYQIISRIGSGVTMSGDGESTPKVPQDALSELVLKLCQQHPHHTLIQLIALKNGSDAAGKNARAFRTNVGDTKSAIARQYLDALRRTDQRELIEAQDTLANLYIQLALLNTEQYQQKNVKDIRLAHVPIINSSVRSSGRERLPNFEQCFRELSRRGGNRDSLPAILTLTIPPRADMDYSRVVRIQSFASTFSITDSGLHRPKILHCSGSNGLRYKQLVKGLDDTRQDLVIEQVFETVNQFLKESEQTRKRKLRLVTYRVVPLSPAAGVLEWVDKTMPFGDYLVTRSSKKMGAHERYHPHEWRHAACRSHLKAAPDKLKAYKQIEARFTPVFHHFFLEKFPDPATWYSRRLAYVRSVAVTSIVGYILGIGDRHAQNILMHEETAEFVHIDFGVVFDQGMALLTPETVPFRLTRDMVDGMGVSGCDGVFSRCCEATLQLLRAKAASVVTILEVFVHDPLYRWMLSPLKALRLQKDDQGGIDNGLNASGDQQDEEEEDGASNDAAARALLRVRQKLEGFEDPNGNALSIEGQVKHLISEAQDPRNLCRLFPGWAPWI